jgi:protein phosphatase
MNGRQRIEIGQQLHPGRVRPHNQDSLGISQGIDPAHVARKGRLLVVADGLGKDGVGATASYIAVQTVQQAYYADPSPEVLPSLVQAISRANQAILQEVRQNPAYRGMGTTLTACVIRGQHLFVAHVGDSRAYLIRGPVIRQLTSDHTWLAMQQAAGQLPEEQLSTHPDRWKLTRSLGARPGIQVDQHHERLRPGDRVVLCTDGLSDLVSESEIRDAVVRQAPQAAAQALATAANERGGQDNLAVIVARPASRGALAGLPVVPLAAIGATVLLALLAILIWPPGQPEPTPTPSVVASASLSATLPATATPTPSPVGTTVPVTVTKVGITPSATATPTPSPTSISTSTPTPSPAATYPAPALRAPADGQTFSGPDAEIVLEWDWPAELGPDQYYLVTIDYPHDGATWQEVQWVTEPRFQVPAYLYTLLSGDRQCEWRVGVMQQTGTQEDGTPVGESLGPPSETRIFVWHRLEVSPSPTFEKP